uniref:Uncharacterized protein n=1 Tax=Rhizophora mucronata TaxID=61149 RepID=A0A2P2Q468_RHIMU
MISNNTHYSGICQNKKGNT